MNARLVEVRHVHGCVLHVVFSDGVAGDIDLTDELDGEIFEPLRDVELFRQADLDPKLRTVVWPNGADLAPEFLRARLRVDA